MSHGDVVINVNASNLLLFLFQFIIHALSIACILLKNIYIL